MSPIRKDIGTKQQGRYMFVEHREYKFQRYEGKQPNENEQVWKTLETQKLYCIRSIVRVPAVLQLGFPERRRHVQEHVEARRFSEVLSQLPRYYWFVWRGRVPVHGLYSGRDLLAHAHATGPAAARLARHHGRLISAPHFASATTARLLVVVMMVMMMMICAPHCRRCGRCCSRATADSTAFVSVIKITKHSKIWLFNFIK